MPHALLETKMYVPRMRPATVRRPRLVDAMDANGPRLLTLVSAPPGFGKTTLLVEWLTAATGSAGPRIAWLSLDREDDDPETFWTYVVAAIRRSAPDVGATAMRALGEGPALSIPALITTLLNDLAASAADLVLVLDDFHVIESSQIQSQVAFLLDNAPPELRLVIVGRADPSFPLAGLRARGDLTEVRAAQLRFTTGEATTYLERAMDRPLAVADVAALETRTEGWIAALQLAALSMTGVENVSASISRFAGDDRFILDYLVEEVLDRQPASGRAFLLRTSILDRLCGPLCDAVSGLDGSKRTLEGLDRDNVFLVPLDERRRWYRYHHLFADVLRARLEEEQPEEIPELHRRASEWYEGSDEPVQAVHHAISAGDSDRAASLVERFIPSLRRSRDDATIERWLNELPPDVFPSRPGLSVQYAGTKLARGESEGVEELLRLAESATAQQRFAMEAAAEGGPATLPPVGESPLHVPSWIAVYRSANARLGGDLKGTVAYARRALELASADDDVLRGSASALLGLAHWTNGDLSSARTSYSAGMDSLRRAGHLADVVGGAVTLADISITQGRLREAMRLYRSGLALATEGRKDPLRGAADMHVGMSELSREHNDLEAAARHLEASSELGDLNGLPKNPYRWHVVAARLQLALGDLDAAEELVDRADELYTADFSPEARPVWVDRGRIAIAQGRHEEVVRWAQERGLSAMDAPSYLQEAGHLVVARALLKRGSSASRQEADLLLEKLLSAAVGGGRNGSVVEILVLTAIARHGDIRAALLPLERALALAEPEGYRRMFLDEGRPMQALLRVAAQRGIAASYAAELLAAPPPRAPAPAAVSAGSRLLDPLSERELDVLRLLASELSGPDISRQLVVSLNTVRTHTKSIYSKLGVNSRREAVRRAGELGLVSRR